MLPLLLTFKSVGSILIATTKRGADLRGFKVQGG